MLAASPPMSPDGPQGLGFDALVLKLCGRAAAVGDRGHGAGHGAADHQGAQPASRLLPRQGQDGQGRSGGQTRGELHSLSSSQAARHPARHKGHGSPATAFPGCGRPVVRHADQHRRCRAAARPGPVPTPAQQQHGHVFLACRVDGHRQGNRIGPGVQQHQQVAGLTQRLQAAGPTVRASAGGGAGTQERGGASRLSTGRAGRSRSIWPTRWVVSTSASAAAAPTPPTKTLPPDVMAPSSASVAWRIGRAKQLRDLVIQVGGIKDAVGCVVPACRHHK